MQPPGLSCLLFDPMDNSRKQIISLAIAIALMVLSALWIARAVVRFSNLQMDFDDAYQYAVAEKRGLVLVSFDSDFDRTERKRKVPAELL